MNIKGLIHKDVEKATDLCMWVIQSSAKSETTPVDYNSGHFLDKYGNINIVAGQMTDKYTLHGLGRKIYLVPQKNNGKLTGYQYNFCFIQEGQFKNGLLNGFGRCIYSNKMYEIGWYLTDVISGYCRVRYDNDQSFTGL